MGTVAAEAGEAFQGSIRAALNQVTVDADEWERTQRQAQLSMQLWVALLDAVDAAGMGLMIPDEVRTLVHEVKAL